MQGTIEQITRMIGELYMQQWLMNQEILELRRRLGELERQEQNDGQSEPPVASQGER